jgi:EpsI family protein
MKAISFKRILVASGLLLLTLLSVNHFREFKRVHPLKPLSEFPIKIGPWTGIEGRFDREIYDILGVDDSFLCDYRNRDGELIQLYIGYYDSQREGDLIHSPKNCMPGSGWNIISASIIGLPNHDNPAVQTNIIKLILEKGNQRQVVLYWFQSRGRIISSEYWQKIYLVWDAFLKHRTDGSFVRLIAPIKENEVETTGYMQAFALRLFPVLEQYLPGA